MRKKTWAIIALSVCSLLLAACGAATQGSSNTSESSSNSVSNAEHVHKMNKIKAIEPSCKSYGQKEGWVCSSCKKYFLDEEGVTEVSVDDLRIDKLPHAGAHYAAAEATCGKAGNIEYYDCDTCEQYFADEARTVVLTEEEIFTATTPHLNLVHNETVYGNGYETGRVEHWYCDVCEGYYTDEAGEIAASEEELTLAAPFTIVDFVVEVPVGKTPVILQFSDTQIIDAAQARPGRTGVDYTWWATDQIEERCYDYLTETINATKPDFIFITGDVVYGEFDDAGTALVSFIEFMDSFQIPWSPVFGNHDNESKKGVDWQCEQFKNAKYCLFDQKTLTGNGNYSVGIAQGGVITRAFYLLDSNGCGAASTESLANGHTTTAVGFGADQIKWYTEQITELKQASPNTKISFAYHIQQEIFGKAYEKYGFIQSQKEPTINIDIHPDKADTDFGYIGRQMKGPWDSNYTVYNGMKALGCDSIFVGHEHCNSASVVYEGVRFQFGQKSSEYDRFNCISLDGKITGGYSKTSTSLIGGTVIPLGEDGEILTPYIYYCGFENGQIDWNDISGSLKKPDPIVSGFPVNGLQYGGVNVAAAELWADGAVVAEAVAFDETINAYKVTANAQGKLHVNVGLLKGKTAFTFTVYMPSTSTAKLQGFGQFALRTKPNESEPSTDGKVDGYIDYDTDSNLDSVKLKYDEWQTFTVDITEFAAVATEFAFNIAAGNVIYLRDIAVS